MNGLSRTDSNAKPIVIGLYGIPGSGKTTLLGQLGQFLDPSKFLMFEGSEVINTIVPGGIEAFKKSDDKSKYSARCNAIEHVRDICINNKKAGIVTGHLIFWHQNEANAQIPVHTHSDLNIYTHIVYLSTEPRTIFQRRENDQRKLREKFSVERLRTWQSEEIKMLRKICRESSILFKSITTTQPLTEIVILVNDFTTHNEELNLARARNTLDEAVTDLTETMLVFDADKTLAPVDTSELFWEETPTKHSPLPVTICGPTPYTYFAFRQVMLLYEEAVGEQDFDQICRRVAKKVQIHPELMSLITRVSSQKHMGCVVVTSGIRRLWQLILENHGFPHVKIIGGGRLKDNYVVSKDVKTALVEYLRSRNIYVCAFGDSPLDLGMLSAANSAIVVVGPPMIRSRTMREKVQDAINKNGLEARQLLLPDSDKKIDVSSLPVMKLDEETLRPIFCRRVRVVTANITTAKLLMTPTRNAEISGPELREAHRRIGWYLANQCLSKLIGVETYDIAHVQGKVTDGYRLAQEKKTTIIALMRGGEPMAFGISDAMPNSMFLHAYKLSDVSDHHVKDQSTVIIVDSVINTGKSIVEFVHGLRGFNSAAKIIVVAGVVQQDAVFDKGSNKAFLSMELGHLDDVTMVALRTSENKFTGSGTTDTGNRLFNTPHIL